MKAFTIRSIDHIALEVQDHQRSIRWYREILGFERLEVPEWGNIPVFMTIPGSKKGMALFENPNGNPLSMPADRRSGRPHFAFEVDMENFNNAQAHLKEKGVEFDFQDHVIAHSIYFRDPDDYCLELTTYDL